MTSFFRRARLFIFQKHCLHMSPLRSTERRFSSTGLKVTSISGPAEIEKSRDTARISHAIVKAIKQSGTADPSRNAWLHRLINLEGPYFQLSPQMIGEAVKRGLHALQMQTDSGYEECRFEARFREYNFIIDCLCADRGQTEQQVRRVLQGLEGAVLYDTPGHVMWMFKPVGVVEMFAPLLPDELQTIRDQVQRAAVSNPNETSDQQRPPIIVPQSIDFDEIMIDVMEMGASDIYSIAIPAHLALESNDIPFYQVSDHLKQSMISPIQSVQVVCNSKPAFQEFKRNLAAEMRKSKHRVRPYVHREAFMFMPDPAHYESEVVWQSLPSDNQQISDIILNVLAELKQIDGVLNVYHNIRAVDPWAQHFQIN